MIELERIDELCQKLAMGTLFTHLAHTAEEAVRKDWSYQEFFERMLQAEHRERQERSRVQLTKTAGFPAIKTIEQYDCSVERCEKQIKPGDLFETRRPR